MNWSLPLLLVVGVLARFQLVPFEPLVLTVAAYCVVALIRALGRDIPVLETTSAIYSLQLLIGPWISYLSPPWFDRYRMVISEETYFSYAIPAVVAYLLPLAFVRHHLGYLAQIMDFRGGRRVFEAGVIICLIGLSESIWGRYMPGSLAFVAFLVGELKFVGALYCYFCRHGQRRWVLFGVFTLTIITSLSSAMFHQVLLWGTIMVSLVIYREFRRPYLGLRVGCIVAGITGVIILQVYKDEYRETLEMNPERGIVSNLLTAASRGSLDIEGVTEVLTVRLNQGWIVSNVMNHVPRHEPFAGGTTLLQAMRDAFLPRLLFEKAARGGGREHFRRFTGLHLRSDTSMGISPVGEVYANLGENGGIAAMFGYGCLFAGTYYFLTTRRNLHVLFLLWIPVIFSQALKAETELTIVLNHLVKAAAFCVITYIVLHQILFGQVKAPVHSTRVPAGPPEPTGTTP